MTEELEQKAEALRLLEEKKQTVIDYICNKHGMNTMIGVFSL